MNALDDSELPSIAKESLTWQEWKRAWLQATDLSTAIGLLHTVYDVQFEDHSYRQKQEQIIFLIRLADGHREDVDYVTNSLRKKAFQVLAEHLFKRMGQDFINDLSHEMRETLIWFFRGEVHTNQEYWQANAEWYWLDTPNISHAYRLASYALGNFCQCLWSVDQQAPRAAELQIAAVDILHSRKALLTLLPSRDEEWKWSRFTPPVVVRIRELALSDAETLEQAVLKGSSAARLFIQVKAGLAELERLKTIKA